MNLKILKRKKLVLEALIDFVKKEGQIKEGQLEESKAKLREINKQIEGLEND